MQGRHELDLSSSTNVVSCMERSQDGRHGPYECRIEWNIPDYRDRGARAGPLYLLLSDRKQIDGERRFS